MLVVVDVALYRAGYQSIKQHEKKKLACHDFGYLYHSSSTAYAANDNNKKKTFLAGIHVHSCGIAGFTEHRTAFTRAQSAILQSYA